MASRASTAGRLARQWQYGRAMRHAHLVVAGLVLASGAACGADPEYAVLIRAFAPNDEALRAGTEIRLDAWMIESGARETTPGAILPRDVPTDGALRASVQLVAPGAVEVHLEARGEGGVYAATRCYTVVGITRSVVMLSGPLGDVEDPDGDGWPSLDACQPRGDGSGCDARCLDDLVRDCMPDDPDGHPGAQDTCGDGDDQDCDGDDDACGDDDGDGVPRCPVGVSVGCDCNDEDPEVNPGADESPASLCENGVDDDCDGEDSLCDDDGDGVPRCPDEAPAPAGCDCDDTDAAVHPGASETPNGECNGRDDNCNGITDEDPSCLGDDLDLDGSEVANDCNDCSAAMTPGGSERCGDRVDGDCTQGGTDDGQPLPPGTDACDPDDADKDGVIAATAGGTDCDDGDPTRLPGAPDRCDDGVDADCSGTDSSCATDGDGDGFNLDNDCDDADATRAPGVADECNGRDDDCDGRIDEDLAVGTGCIQSGAAWEVVDFATNLVHCGHCRASCNVGCSGSLCRADTCDAGACACSGGPACDGGLDAFCCPGAGCRDLVNDTANCGGCGVVCAAVECRTAVCDAGVCGEESAVDGTDCSSGRKCCGGDCTGECAPSAVETRACGNCGSQTRTCSAGCAWGDWGACTGSHPCSPGQAETAPCGNCGTQQRVCGADCEWPAWGNCAGEGACAAGAIRQQPCGQCGNQEQRCSASCQWQDSGNCDNDPVGASCDDGDACTADACAANGQCTHGSCGAGTTCCGGLGCTRCCGGDVSRCGNEPLCADWQCSSGVCAPLYDPRNTDPENECTGHRCCTGGGACRDTEQNC